jgi:hypothetical protein
MSELEQISTDTVAVQWSQQTARGGLISMIPIGLALVLGVVTGHPAAGAIAAGAAFTVGFAIFHRVMGSAVISMLIVTAGIASATYAGSISAKWTAAVLAVVAIAAINYGLLSGLGASAGWIGQQSGVYLVVATYFPRGPHYASGRAAMVVCGGLLQIAIHELSGAKFIAAGNGSVWSQTTARVGNYLGRLPGELRWGSETLAYAVRLVVTLLFATALYRTLHLRNGYWVPMTALLVLKPQWTGTASRSLARLVGTLGGAAIGFGLAHAPVLPGWIIGTMVVVCAFACYALQAVNYALFSLFITLYIVFLFRFGGFSESAAAELRLINTAIGGFIALVVDLAWQALCRALPRKFVQ